MTRRFLPLLAVGATFLAVPTTARADTELRGHLEGAGAHFLAIGGAWQAREIGYGMVGAGALEVAPSRSFGIEGRLLAGRFLQGDAPDNSAYRRVSETGLFGLSLGLRWLPIWDDRGPWLAGSFGGVRTGSLTRPSFDARLGWDFRLGGAVRGGPFLGYMQVIQPDDALRPEDGHAIVFGLHAAYDSEKRPVQKPLEEEPHPPMDLGPAPPPKVQCDPAQPADPRFADAHGCLDPLNAAPLSLPDRCPDEPEDFIGGSDADGCPGKDAEVKVIGDEIVLNDRVYFDFGLARVKHKSWPLLKSLAKLILAHPEYVVVHIHGHTDEIGDDQWNQKLSEDRAAAVRKKLIEYGVPAARLSSKGFGKSKPRVSGTDEGARQENRRVEFLIERKVKVTGGQP